MTKTRKAHPVTRARRWLSWHLRDHRPRPVTRIFAYARRSRINADALRLVAFDLNVQFVNTGYDDNVTHFWRLPRRAGAVDPYGVRSMK